MTLINCAVLLCCMLATVQSSPITNPLKDDADIAKVIPEYFDFKRTKDYHMFSPNASIDAFYPSTDYDATCNVEFKLRWSTAVGSPVYSTPVAYPDRNTGKKNIFLNTYFQYVELLQYDGFKPYGWPISFEDSSFQSSPLLYDIDGDGNIDIGIVDKNANMFWIRVGEFGEYLEDYHIQIPKLKVKKDWADKLDPTFVDSYVVLSMFDHSGDFNAEDRDSKNTNGAQSGEHKARIDDLKPNVPVVKRAVDGLMGSEKETGDHIHSDQPRRRLNTGRMSNAYTEEHDDFVDSYYSVQLQAAQQRQSMQWEEESGDIENGSNKNKKHDSDDLAKETEYLNGEEYFQAGGGAMDDGFNYYSNRRFGMYGGMYNDSNYAFVDAHVLATPVLADVNADGHMEIIFSVSYFFDKMDYPEGSAKRSMLGTDVDPDMYVGGGIACWDMESQDWAWLVHLDLTTAKSHFQAMIYSSVTVADLDGDGRSEVVIGTALGLLYVLDGESGFTRRFFPMQFHSIQAQIAVADVVGGPDLEMLVVDMGGSVACVSLSGDVLWDATLSGSLPFTPTVGDVDGDGFLDVVVVAVTEIEDVVDSSKKKEDTKHRRKSTASKGCDVWVLRGDTGVALPGYPLRLPASAAASSSVLLADLRAYSAADGLGNGINEKQQQKMEKVENTFDMLKNSFTGGPFEESLMFPPPVVHGRQSDKSNSSSRRDAGLHLILSSFDGHVYVIDGRDPKDSTVGGNSDTTTAASSSSSSKCVQRIDVGEHVYSMPLLDDISGDGFLDMVVGTMNGHVLMFETNVPHHSMNSWSSFPKGRLNGFTHGQIGISVSEEERARLKQLDIRGGAALTVAFTIHDNRYKSVFNSISSQHGGAGDSRGTLTSDGGETIPEGLRMPDFGREIKYSVTITRGANRLNPLFRNVFAVPGLYRAEVLLPPPQAAQLVISVVTEHGLYFEETVDVALSTRFYIWLKYLVISPVVVFCVPLLLKYMQRTN